MAATPLFAQPGQHTPNDYAYFFVKNQMEKHSNYTVGQNKKTIIVFLEKIQLYVI
jgi:hypothetical protein